MRGKEEGTARSSTGWLGRLDFSILDSRFERELYDGVYVIPANAAASAAAAIHIMRLIMMTFLSSALRARPSAFHVRPACAVSDGSRPADGPTI